MTKGLPQFARDMIASPPQAGEGVNRWCFRTARILHPYRTEEQIADILRAALADCGRSVTEKEIQRAIARPRDWAWKPGETNPVRSTPPWPPVNQEQRQSVIENGYQLVDLWEESPVRFDDDLSHAEDH
jgi:hypothetical protein